MRSVLAHGVLAVGGLILAWLVWVTPEEERSPDEVELVACDPEDVTSLVLDVDNREVKLERRGQGDERAYWVTVTRRPEPREGQAEAPEPTVDEFVGGRKRVDEYLAKIAPLRALRSLGELDEETTEEVELGEEAGRFVYACGERTVEYTLGATAFGTGDRYLREADGNTAYLLAADAIRDLQSAEALLMQRELNDFEPTEVENLVVKIEDRERRLLQRNRRDPERAEWVDASEPDRRNELFGNWLERVSQLRVQDYLALDAEPGADIEGESAATTQALTLEYLGSGGDRIGHLELARVDTQPARYYARSDATQAWVTVPRSIAQQVEDDARTVLGLEPIDRPEPEPPPQPTPTTPAADAGAATGAAPPTPPGHPPLPPGHP